MTAVNLRVHKYRQSLHQAGLRPVHLCEKWLKDRKDRKGRSLTLSDIEHYQQTVAALARTQQLMQAIDAATAGTLWPSVGQLPRRIQ